MLLASKLNRSRLVQGIYQEKEKILVHSYSSTWAQQARPDGVSLPLAGPVSVYPETSVVISSQGPEGKEKGFYQKIHNAALQMGSKLK